MQQAGEAAVGEDFASGLAAGAVVGFVVGVANAENLIAATRAGLTVAAMHSHSFAKGSDLFREGGGGFSAETIEPELQGLAGRGEETLPLVGGQMAGKRGGGELGGVEDFVGVGIADAAEQVLIGESALEGAVLGGQRRAEGFEIGGEWVEAARVERAQACFSANHMERGATLGAGFGEDEGAVGKIEGGEVAAAGEFGMGWFPVQAAGDHEVKNQPEIVVETNGDALADPAERADGVAFGGREGLVGGAEEKGAVEADVLERLIEDAGLERGEVGGDVGEFGHW